jgi:D-alanyl-D-alanine carboxypeptidase
VGLVAVRTIEHALDSVVQAGVHGLVASVRHPSGDIHHFAAGVADIASRRPMVANSFSRVASVTKLFTATAVLRMVADGRVDLDDTASAHLTAELTQELGSVTVRHLLAHTSGIAEPEPLLFPSIRNASLESVAQSRDRFIPPAELVRLSLGLPRGFVPGASYWYSNANYHLLGLILENVAGESAYDVIESTVIAPAGLRNTYFPRDYGGLPSPSFTGYDSLYQSVNPELAVTAYDMSCVYTAGALVSTPGDLLVFASKLFAGDIIPADAVEQMSTAFTAKDGTQVGLGLQRTSHNDVPLLGAEGVFFGTQTVLMSTENGSRAWAISLNTTKYQRLGVHGWPEQHPVDVALAALGSTLSRWVFE